MWTQQDNAKRRYISTMEVFKQVNTELNIKMIWVL